MSSSINGETRRPFDCITKKKIKMIRSVLIANRGEIAVRVARTLRSMNIRSVAIYSSVDANSLHVSQCDHAVELKRDCQQAELYLQSDLIISIAKEEHVDAIFPGYGFLSENAQFAIDCEKAGLIFIGPTSEHIRLFGLKHLAYEIAEQAHLPLLEHSKLLNDLEHAQQEAERIGFPLMLKCSAGSGGNGIQICRNQQELNENFEKIERSSLKFYKNQSIYLERWIEHGKHIEIQIFGDGQGHVICLNERDCSIQRRNQKILEETPAIHIDQHIKQQIFQSALDLTKSVQYQSAGTVEFIFDLDTNKYYFLEVNSRLQVEHTITEQVFNIDLVQWMIELANGQPPQQQIYQPFGHAIQLRICSEEPLQDFKPSSGILYDVHFPDNVRIDTFIQNQTQITPFYDSLLAKVIVHAPTRRQTIDLLAQTLAQIRILGINTNLEFFKNLIQREDFTESKISLNYLSNDSLYEYQAFEIIESGTFTTIQDYPGRIGYWDIGVPPSGPIDDYAFRMANRLVANSSVAAAIEATLIGPTIRFHCSTSIALTGATTDATLNQQSIQFWTMIQVQRGDLLQLGQVKQGCRTYLAIRGGIRIHDYLRSKSTFVLGKFGGYAGRTLINGDVLYIDQQLAIPTNPIDNQLIPIYPTQCWQVAVLYGPHGAPDFFQMEYIHTFFQTKWKVHHNSNRLGVRLIGPKPLWTRTNGGQAGLHPSNIHDCEYAIGSINFTGDSPVILTHDGPSLGGFVCPVTIVQGDLWKIGQVKPNDFIQFYPIDFQQAVQLQININQQIETLKPCPTELIAQPIDSLKCILYQFNQDNHRPLVVYRQAGDRYILIEYGQMILDFNYRFRIHFLIDFLKKQNQLIGIEQYSPGVRSLQIKYNPLSINQKQLLTILITAEQQLDIQTQNYSIPTRIIHLPLAFEDSQTTQAVQRYQQTVRHQAPWLPNNVDFIQRINGLSSRQQVQQIIFDASYLVLGLGDVYLGAPCAVPIDPRHRLNTSKYNPARTFTPEGTVGIGGVYMCIYGMDSPGGYQLLGKTLPIWNTFVNNRNFQNKQPWLLRFFDQIKFYPVDEQQLHQQRQLFAQDKFHIHIEDHLQFDLKQYQQFLNENQQDIQRFQIQQEQAFQREVSLWQQQQQQQQLDEELELPSNHQEFDGLHTVKADICGSIWKILIEQDQHVQQHTPIIILEAMKMEIIIRAPIQGQIKHILCRQGQLVQIQQTLCAILST